MMQAVQEWENWGNMSLPHAAYKFKEIPKMK